MPAAAKDTPENMKNEVLQAMREVREKILAAAAALPTEKREGVFLGVWGVKELLAHLAGWDYANREAAEAVLAETLPAFYTHYDKDWKTYNALLVAQYRRDDLLKQIVLVREAHQELVAYLERISPSDFVKDTGVRFHGWRVTIERLLRAEISDEEKHLAQVEAWAIVSLDPK
jgi:hypothetical protein